MNDLRVRRDATDLDRYVLWYRMADVGVIHKRIIRYDVASRPKTKATWHLTWRGVADPKPYRTRKAAIEAANKRLSEEID